MKKNTLFEIIKKEKQFKITTFLNSADILNLSLLSKKFYSQLAAILELNRLDNQQNMKQLKNKNPKSKNNKQKKDI